MNLRRHGANCLPRIRFNFVAEPGAKSNRAKYSQFVFFETPEGIANRAHHLSRNIFLTTHEIENPFLYGIVKKSIDREIAPQHVGLRIGEHHPSRTPSVDI